MSYKRLANLAKLKGIATGSQLKNRKPEPERRRDPTHLEKLMEEVAQQLKVQCMREACEPGGGREEPQQRRGRGAVSDAAGGGRGSGRASERSASGAVAELSGGAPGHPVGCGGRDEPAAAQGQDGGGARGAHTRWRVLHEGRAAASAEGGKGQGGRGDASARFGGTGVGAALDYQGGCGGASQQLAFRTAAAAAECGAAAAAHCGQRSGAGDAEVTQARAGDVAVQWGHPNDHRGRGAADERAAGARDAP
eukprot:ctg_2362.g754